MKLKLSILIVISSLLIGSTQLFGQIDSISKNNIQLSFGMTHNRLIDKAFSQSRLKFSGASFNTLLSYQRKVNDYIINGQLLFGKGNVTQKSIELKASLYNIQLAFSYARKITKYTLLGKDNKLYIGPKLSLFDYILIDESILENASITFNNTVDIVIVQTTKINQKSYFELELSLPLAGFRKRDSSDGGANNELEDDFKTNLGSFFFKNSKASFLNPLSLIRLKADYSISIAKKTDFTINYFFNYVSNTNEPSVNLYDNGFSAGLKFKF